MLAQWVPSLGEHKSGEQRQFFLKTLLLRQSTVSQEVAKARRFTRFGGALRAKTRKTTRRSRFGSALGNRGNCRRGLAYRQVCLNMQRLYRA
jgi:hypothetical protein